MPKQEFAPEGANYKNLQMNDATEARMERVFAFTDESGAFGWQLDNANVSTYFIIGAVIV